MMQSSFSIVRKREVLPLPTLPTMATFSQAWKSKVTSLSTVSVNCWFGSVSISSPVSRSYTTEEL